MIADLQEQLAALKAATPVTAPAPVVVPAPAPVVTEPVADENAFTHYIHLADGRVLKAMGFVTRWHDTDSPNDPGVGVVGVYPR
jgi:hypothetical protein